MRTKIVRDLVLGPRVKPCFVPAFLGLRGVWCGWCCVCPNYPLSMTDHPPPRPSVTICLLTRSLRITPVPKENSFVRHPRPTTIVVRSALLNSVVSNRFSTRDCVSTALHHPLPAPSTTTSPRPPTPASLLCVSHTRWVKRGFGVPAHSCKHRFPKSAYSTRIRFGSLTKRAAPWHTILFSAFYFSPLNPPTQLIQFTHIKKKT